MAGVIIAWISGSVTGADAQALAAAVTLALAPALAALILLPRLDRAIPALGVLLVWLVATGGLVAGTGGVSSPLSLSLAIAPAWALALGRRWAPEAGAGAVLVYAVCAWLARFASTGGLGAFPEALAVVSLAFVAGLMAISQERRQQHDTAAFARLAEVSHELRTPLTHILGFSEMIERKIFGELGDRYAEYAGLIRKSGLHLLGLVNDLLDMSKIEAGRYDLQKVEFDARTVVEEVVRLSADSAAKKEIALGMLTPDQPLIVHADDRALKRMLINILGNAIKFTPAGGRVMVRLEARDRALVLETSDTGPGIPEEERKTLGRPYQRGSAGAHAEGTGLGLSLVRALAGLHGGELSFHDAPEGGAQVRITLPVLSKSAGP
jgi:signal transduction histidine kinase